MDTKHHQGTTISVIIIEPHHVYYVPLTTYYSNLVIEQEQFIINRIDLLVSITDIYVN